VVYSRFDKKGGFRRPGTGVCEREVRVNVRVASLERVIPVINVRNRAQEPRRRRECAER